MVEKSVFIVISVCKTKIAWINAQKLLRNFGCKRRGPIFQVWGGEKEGGGTKIFFKILGGNQSLTHYGESGAQVFTDLK